MSFLRSRHFVFPTIAFFLLLIPFAPASDEKKREHYAALAFAPQGGGRTVNTGTLFVSVKQGQNIASVQVINRLRARLARLPGIRVFMAPVQDVRVGAFTDDMLDGKLAKLLTQ